MFLYNLRNVPFWHFIFTLWDISSKEKIRDIQGHASGKETVCQCRRHRVMGLIPELGRSPGREHHNPLQYSCLWNPMDRGAWWAIVHWVAKSWTQLKQLSPHHRKYKNRKKRERKSAFLASYHVTHSVYFLDFTFEMEYSGFWIITYMGGVLIEPLALANLKMRVLYSDRSSSSQDLWDGFS